MKLVQDAQSTSGLIRVPREAGEIRKQDDPRTYRGMSSVQGHSEINAYKASLILYDPACVPLSLLKTLPGPISTLIPL